LPQKPITRKRGRPKKSKTQNLLLRLGNQESWVLAFFHDINVPFTNNLAEQDIHMINIRLKISGCFRTLQDAKQFAISEAISPLQENEDGISWIP